LAPSAGSRVCSTVQLSRAHRDLHSFPTRRSSDLDELTQSRNQFCPEPFHRCFCSVDRGRQFLQGVQVHGPQFDVKRQRCIMSTRDRKSTRLNSSHVKISYAVFCLKKKKQNREQKS